jgi:hypothetical protein
MTHKVTIFKNIKETITPYHVELDLILNRIKDGSDSKVLVQKIRKEKRKAERNELKKQLPAICFSGTFNKRADNSLIVHSGIICLDFDGYPNFKLLMEDKESLSSNKYVYSVFVSPSGNGLKVLVKIPQDAENHTKYFNSLENYFNSEYFDKTSKNISRVCYESFDPIIHINPKSSLWDKIEEEEYVEVSKHKDPLTIPITDENKIVDILLKWWTKKFPMTNGQRNQNTYVLASALNDYGINKSLASYVLGQFSTKDFTNNEIERTITSAYAHTQNFGTKYYEDEERVNQVKGKLRRGVSKKEIRNQLEETKLDKQIIDSVLNKAEESNNNQTFWIKNDKGTIKIVHVLFKEYLEDNGFYKFCPEGSKNYVFVRVQNNLIDHTTEKDIKDFILSGLLTIDDLSIYNYFADNTRFFKDEFLTLLSSVNIYFIADSKNTSYLYYRNCAVKITKESLTLIDYIDLGGFVWNDHVIDRDFHECSVGEFDYKVFIQNICAKNESRVKSMESTIGFLMHGWKNLSYCPAVILNDEVISDNPEGGTGKGLFMNALAHMKKCVTIDGKSFNFDKSFAYQLVSADTQILCFDDVKKYFDFERLFSLITEGLTLEKKNKDSIKIPFNKSPKIAITTNYAIKGAGNSFARRKWELELHQYYNKAHTPYDEFNKLMFGDWDDDMWCEFDNYMIQCLQLYLDQGLIQSVFVNLKVRQLSAETSHDFIEWCGLITGHQPNDLLKKGIKLWKQELYFNFIEENPDYGPKAKMTISRTRFYKWLSAYGMFKEGVLPEEGRDAQGKWIRFRNKHDMEYNSKLDM